MRAAIVRMGALALAGCGDAHVLVTVTARATVSEVRSLDVTVRDADDEAGSRFELTPAAALPQTFVVATDGRSGTITIAALARDRAGVLVGLGQTSALVGGQTAATLRLDPADVAINARVAGDQDLVPLIRAAHGGQNVAAAPDGGFVALFEHSPAVAGRRFGPGGRPSINATSLNALDFELDGVTLDEIAATPAIAAGPGGFVAAWERPVDGLTATRAWVAVLDAEAGTTSAPVALAADDGVARRFPRVTAIDGGWVATWQQPSDPFDEYQGELRARRLDATGAPIGAEIVVAAGATGHHDPQVAALAGGFAVVWEEAIATRSEIHLRRFDAVGAALGPVQPLVTTGLPAAPRLVATTDGLALVYFDFAGAGGNPWWLVRLGVDGAPRGAPIEVARTDTLPDGGRVEHSALATGAAGELAITWTMFSSDGLDADVWLRAFTADGAPCGDAAIVNSTRVGFQELPSVARFGSDAFVVVWDDASGVAPDSSGGGVRGRVVYPCAP